MKALVALEDGTVFWGRSFTGPGEAAGEIVFNTGMTGYQEVLTDPSYKGQIITMTYPLIGNYGTNDLDMESSRIHAEAFLVKEYCRYPSNFRSTAPLAAFLGRFGILGVEGIDSRALTRHIRNEGALKAMVSTLDLAPDSLVGRARAAAGLEGRDLVREVTCDRPYLWTAAGPAPEMPPPPKSAGRFRVAVYDFGIKYNQLRLMAARGCDLCVLPATTPAAAVLALEPDGIFLSNGPGDPAGVEGVLDNLRLLLGEKPIFGICLGQQMLGLAFGGSTYKLKFGHRGVNQPVKDLESGRVEITSQNHGFCVDAASVAHVAEVTHINLNDGSVEGMRHKSLPVFSVQYHPENAPGPHDAEHLFDRFIEIMRAGR